MVESYQMLEKDRDELLEWKRKTEMVTAHAFKTQEALKVAVSVLEKVDDPSEVGSRMIREMVRDALVKVKEIQEPE